MSTLLPRAAESWHLIDGDFYFAAVVIRPAPRPIVIGALYGPAVQRAVNW